MAALLECSEQPSRCSKRTTGGQEARIDTREGREFGRLLCRSELILDYRSMRKKLPKSYNAAKNKSVSETETSTTSGNEREANEEAGAGVEVIEGVIVIPIAVRHETQDLHLLGAAAHQMDSVVLHHHVRLTHTFHLAEVVAD